MNSVSDVGCLRSSQEEADTRMLLHAAHCAKSGFSEVVIVSEDTDVFVLCVAFSSKIACPIYMKSGTKTRIQYTDIQKVATIIGHDMCDTLLGLHAFTGCDSVSAFAGKGKLSTVKLVRKTEEHQETLKRLGSNWDLSTDLFNSLEALTCQIHCSDSKERSINELRFNLFCARRGEAESWQLPPCSTSLLNHRKRANNNYQCAIWKRSLEALSEIPPPIGNGWQIETEDLVIDWSDAPPALRSCYGTSLLHLLERVH